MKSFPPLKSAHSIQFIAFQMEFLLSFYIIDDSKIEAEVKSDVDSEILSILPHADMIDKYVNDILEIQVGETDMKVRHLLTKSVEVI